MEEELIYDQIRRRAKSVGLTLSALCKDTGVVRKSLHHWKARNPQTIQTYLELDNKLKELENARNGND